MTSRIVDTLEKQQLYSVLIEAVNEGLTVMCSSAASSVYFFLEQSGSIKSRREIGDLKNFSEGLENIFGYGSKVIEKKILEVLCTKLQLPRPHELPDEFELDTEVRRVFDLHQSIYTPSPISG